MSEQQWKLAPVEPTEEMRAEICSGISHEHMVRNYKLMLAAAPQPPAHGDDLETLAWLVDDSKDGHRSVFRNDPTGWAHGYQVRELVDRAHAARLQAEVERLKTYSKKLAELDDSTIKRLGDRLRVSAARTAELERALSGLLFEFDDGVNGGRDEPVPVLDHARTLIAAAEFKPAEGAKSDPQGCNECTHPECGRYEGPQKVECRAMADNACARPTAEGAKS